MSSDEDWQASNGQIFALVPMMRRMPKPILFIILIGALNWPVFGLCQTSEQSFSAQPFLYSSQQTQIVMDFVDAKLNSKQRLNLEQKWKLIEERRNKVMRLMSSKKLRIYLLELLEMRTESSDTLSSRYVESRTQDRALNHFLRARDFIAKSADEKVELDEIFLTQLNSIHRFGNNSKRGYRKLDVAFGTSYEIAITAKDVPLAMSKLISWYSANRKVLHPIELAARFYQKLISIHPFEDANGRTARDAMDFILITNGYPPAIIQGTSFARAGVTFNSIKPPPGGRPAQSPSEVIDVVTDSVVNSLNLLLEAAEG